MYLPGTTQENPLPVKGALHVHRYCVLVELSLLHRAFWSQGLEVQGSGTVRENKII